MERLQDVLECIECPVCFNYMVPPITRCSNGHSICPTCKPRLEHCPTCQGHLVDVRNRLADHVSETFVHPCRYQDSGCTSKLVLGTQEEHEKKCRYGPYKCPFLIVDSVKCVWEGPIPQLEQHIINEHMGYHQVTVTSGKQSCYYPNYMNHIQDGYWHEVVFTFDRIFFSYSKIIDNFLYMCYMFVGAREDNNNYKYTIRIKTGDGIQYYTTTKPCPHYQELIDGEFPNVNCAPFCKDFTNLCVDEKDQLQFQYEILKNRKRVRKV